jgi:hypothetical protein
MEEALFILGALLVAIGLGAIHWYVGLIFLGLVMMAAGYLAAGVPRTKEPAKSP